MTPDTGDTEALSRRCKALEAELEQTRARLARAESRRITSRGGAGDREDTRQALEASELKYRSLFSESPYGVLLVDPEELAMREFNPAMHRMLGYDRETFATMRLPDIEGRHGIEALHQLMHRRLQGPPEEFETELVTRDERRLTALVFAKAIELEGRPFLFCIVRDITAPRELERQLRLNQFALDRTDEAMYIVDGSGAFHFVNHGATRMLGYPREVLTAMTVFDVDPVFSRARFDEVWQRLANGGSTTFETVHRTRDGVEFPVEIFTSYFSYLGEGLLVAMVRDIRGRRENESTLRKLSMAVEQSPASVAITDMDGIIEYVNEAYVEAAGHARAELIGSDIRRLQRAPGLATQEEPWRRLRAGESWRGEREGRRGDGTPITERVMVSPIVAESGEVSHFLEIKEDITAQKRIEGELRRYHERLEQMVAQRTRALEQANRRLQREIEERRQMEVRLRQTQYAVDHAATAIFWLNIHTARVIYANRQALDSLGCGREEILGRRAWELGPDLPEGRWPTFRRVMRRRGVVRFEGRLRRRDGSLLPVDITVYRTDFEGEERLVAFVNDTTRRRAAVEALRESEARFRQIAETIDEVFWLVDWRRDRGIYISPAFEALWQQDPSVFYDDWHAGARSIHPEDAPGAARAFRQAIDRHTGYETEFRIIRPDGSTRWIHDRGFLIFDEAGQVSRIAGLSEDITARKTSELALEQARDEAEAASRAKNVFLSTMSHELRTPLNAIIGFARLMEGEDGLSREHRYNLATINRSGRHLLELINEVLEISRIEAGRVFLEEEAFDLEDTLRTIEEMMSERARHKDLGLGVVRRGTLPHYVRGDGSRLRQVLVNLLGNAVKFTEQGGVELRVEAVEGGIHFAVIDTGPGLRVEDRERIFEAFYQSPASAAMGEGTGLGLAISREFVRLMGGDIIVRSEPGAGTTFEFTIPLREAPRGAMLGRSRGRVVGLAPGQRVPRVLVVEDEPENRRMLVALLEGAGFEVSSAADGAAAVRAFQRTHPHFIWMDMGLPEVDGYEASRRIRVLPGGMEVVIAAQTAAAFSEDRRKILRAGCQEVLVKPLDADEVFEVMGRYLDIEYDYEPEPAAGGGTIPLPPLDLADMDARHVDALHRAAVALDARAVRELLEEAGDTAVTEGLRALVEDFRFEQIIRLCEESRQTRALPAPSQD